MKPLDLYKLAHALLDAPGWSTSYREVTTKGYAGSTAGTRRTLIRAKARPLVEHELSSEDAETLRRYIDDVLKMPDIAATNQFAHVVCPNLSQYDVDEAIKAPPTPTPTQEPDMAKSLTIENKTFLNNVDISTMSDSQIFDLIAAEEARIEALSKIQTKPKRLVAEIESRREALRKLVEHLDSVG